MQYLSLFVTLAIALAASAAPQNQVNGFRGGQGGFGQNRGNQQQNVNQNQNNNAGNAGNAGAAAGAGNNTGAAAGAGAGAAAGAGAGAAAGAGAGAAAGANAQTSLTLDPKVIASGFANDGQDVPADGQVASLTSTNNFINFCLTVPNLVITNGKQVTAGSCNPAPMGVLPSVDNMPSSKFTNPKNGDTIKADTQFTISMAIRGMQTGFFVNAQSNYFAAPQQLNGGGQIQGHSHVVVEQIQALDSTTPNDPKVFAFFKGLNAAAQGGILTADVTNGLPAGVYKLSSINSAANHQPVLVPIAQHGSLDDAVYFTVTADGQAAAGAGAAAGGAAAGGAAAGNAAGGAAAGGAAAGGAAAGNAGAAAGGAAAGGAAAGNAAGGAAAGGAAAGAAGAAGQTGRNGQNGQAGRNGQAGQAAQGQNGQAGRNGQAGQAAQGQNGQAAQGQNRGQQQNNNNGGRGRRMLFNRRQL